jgi:hypothetical protein
MKKLSDAQKYALGAVRRQVQRLKGDRVILTSSLPFVQMRTLAVLVERGLVEVCDEYGLTLRLTDAGYAEAERLRKNRDER